MRVAICLAWSIGLLLVPALAENWPQWRGPTASACELYREVIEIGLGHGRNAKAIW